MPLPEKTLVASGTLGINQAAGTLLAYITDPGAGRYKIWGSVRHTLADGVLLRADATPLISIIPGAPNGLSDYGPIIVDITERTTDIALDLVLATGAADTASGIIYAQRIHNTE